jgi:flagellar hook-basal body complex protein FliE
MDKEYAISLIKKMHALAGKQELLNERIEESFSDVLTKGSAKAAKKIKALFESLRALVGDEFHALLIEALELLSDKKESAPDEKQELIAGDEQSDTAAAAVS